MTTIRTRMNTALAAAALACLAASPAAADASCKGWYEMRATHLDGAKAPAAIDWSFGDFSASADCSGINEEHCRARAAAKLFACFHAHFDERDTLKRPEACGAVEDYAIEDIAGAAAEAVCCTKKARGFNAIKGAMLGRVGGAGNCSVWLRGSRNFPKAQPWSEIVARDYEIDCADVRARLCPKYAKRK